MAINRESRQTVKNLIVIALGGALGAVSRYLISSWIHQWTERTFGKAALFPLGTLIVNVLGSFLLGLVMQIAISTNAIREPWRMAIVIGFLGALTTFSTFSYETLHHAQAERWSFAVANIVASVLLCLLSVWGGMSLARALFQGN